MKRKRNWNALLHAYVQKHLTTPFEWGVFDCLLFPAGAVEEITGKSILPKDLSYDSPFTASKELKRVGLESVEQGLDRLFVRESIARKGDLVMRDLEDGPTLGVCIGHVDAYAGKDGLVYYDIITDDETLKRWRVA